MYICKTSIVWKQKLIGNFQLHTKLNYDVNQKWLNLVLFWLEAHRVVRANRWLYTLYSMLPVELRFISATATPIVSYFGIASCPVMRAFRPPHWWNVVISPDNCTLLGSVSRAVSLPLASCFKLAVFSCDQVTVNSPAWKKINKKQSFKSSFFY